MIPDPPVAKPFLRWAGSKRWLVPQLRSMLQTGFQTYYEPFLGSASAYFSTPPTTHAVLSDANEPLIECYRQVMERPQEVAEIASQWSTDRDSYYVVRALKVAPGTVVAAARFLYLNRLCFNGLYRENRKGEFNVPYGRPRESNVVVDPANLDLVSERMLAASVELKSCDFELVVELATSRDLVYLDPPYADEASGIFTEYNAQSFGWSDQIRLARAFQRAAHRGTKVVLSNADLPEIRKLYTDYDSVVLERFSSISASGGNRTRKRELLVMANLDPMDLRAANA